LYMLMFSLKDVHNQSIHVDFTINI
jgi:hypothetical protein